MSGGGKNPFILGRSGRWVENDKTVRKEREEKQTQALRSLLVCFLFFVTKAYIQWAKTLQ